MNLLKYGDVIGIISPSWVANQKDYEKYAEGIERLGFQVNYENLSIQKFIDLAYQRAKKLMICETLNTYL